MSGRLTASHDAEKNRNRASLSQHAGHVTAPDSLETKSSSQARNPLTHTLACVPDMSYFKVQCNLKSIIFRFETIGADIR